MTTEDNLAAALELLRTGGWIKGSLRRAREDVDVGDDDDTVSAKGEHCFGYCSVGAVHAVAAPQPTDFTRAYGDRAEIRCLAAAVTALGYERPPSTADDDVPAPVRTITDFNDGFDTTFAHVEHVFTHAIELARVTDVAEVAGQEIA
ncbi:hypothetical protein IU500_07085 [Nocardia terpenica]|uniref:DUF6197 family protein n=1 Tax=Nocardia terpenica TaxID=455432 RepID=UPI001895F204|nr:hypothetical protein [Nocardia terpenica]MBF6060541.1 hypothetical protein [Nocardia terpenica]MBF6103801.1 hypothetical protein [Nocardia terpenica]MBF6111825.1 hypothetical protein [Nocardia terpenica]MBF6118022.1 hypothetical protein [Nocardia terpenica]MBF6155252.1 hypothetical protein [Nocardia terpenica]